MLPDGATVRVDAATAFEPDARLRCGPPRDEDAVATRILGGGPPRLDPPGLALTVEDLLGPAPG